MNVCCDGLLASTLTLSCFLLLSFVLYDFTTMLGSQELSNALSIVDFFAIMDTEREQKLKWFAQNVLGSDFGVSG